MRVRRTRTRVIIGSKAEAVVPAFAREEDGSGRNSDSRSSSDHGREPACEREGETKREGE
jgi:hypothetical protein